VQVWVPVQVPVPAVVQVWVLAQELVLAVVQVWVPVPVQRPPATRLRSVVVGGLDR
jgi:hypothetical protein